MEEGSELEALELLRPEAELLTDLECEVGDPARVGRGVLVVGLEGVCERLYGREERALERLVARRRLQRQPCLARDACQELHLPILRSRPSVDGGGDHTPAPVDRERSDREPSFGALGNRCDSRVVVRIDGERLGPREPRLEVLCGDRERGAVGRLGDAREPFERPGDRALQPHRDARAAENARCARGRALGNVRDARCLGELAREREEGLRTFGLTPLRFVQTRVLECDRGMTGHDLEQPEIVGVELVQAELRDHDDSGHARPVLQWHREKRLLDLGGALDLLSELVLCSVADQQRDPGLGDTAGDPAADVRRQELGRVARYRTGEVTAKRDEHEIVVVAKEHAAVVVIDQEPELVGDREPDLRDVVEARQLPGEALEHLQVRDRAHVVAVDRRLGRPLARALVERDDQALPACLRGHHRGLGAGDELARVRRVLGPDRDPCRRAEPSDGFGLERPELLSDPLGECRRGSEVAGRQDHRELLPADPTHDIGLADRGTEHVRNLVEQLIADAVPVDVVHLLEVVQVEHHDGHRLVRRGCLEQRLA